MSSVPIYPMIDANGDPITPMVYENSIFHNDGSAVQEVTDQAIISDKFNDQISYTKGQYCIYNNVLYKFTANKSAGAWDSSKVSATNTGSEFTTLNSTLTLITDTLTPTLPDTDTTEYGTGCAYSKFGHIVIVYFSFKITNAQTGYSHRKSVILNLPNGLNPTRVINEMASNGDADGMTSCSLSPNGTLTIYPQKTGTTYAVGQFTYLI